MAGEKYIIMMMGLPGTGKTRVVRELEEHLDDYAVVSQTNILREQGFTDKPKIQDTALRAADRRTSELCRDGLGVVYDSANKFSFRRQQIYGVASGNSKRILALECVCPEALSKERMSYRKSDHLVSEPSDPKIWDKLNGEWEGIEVDFLREGLSHVFHAVYDSDQSTFSRGFGFARPEEYKGMDNFLADVGNIVTSIK